MDIQKEREIKEMKSLFEDPKFARKAFKAIGGAIAMRPALSPLTRQNKDGDETNDSQLERYTYNQLYRDCQLAGEYPTELEVMMACQFVKARTDTSAATFIRDTIGGKPIDESKIDTTINQFDELTDEELEAIKALRDSKLLPPPSDDTTSLVNPEVDYEN